MRRAILIIMAVLAAGTSQVAAQHYVGVKGGYGAAHGRFYQKPQKSGLVMGRSTGGVAWKYYGPQQVLGGVGAELEYQMRGYRHFKADIRNSPINETTEYTVTERTVSTLTLPLVWQPHLYFARRHVRVFLSAGISVSYNMGIGDKVTVSKYGFNEREERTIDATTTPYKMDTARDVRWGYGWLGGFGVGVLAGRWEFAVEGRYYYGMSDLLRNKVKYHFHDGAEDFRPLRSELDNIYITFGVFYRLGKGGILAPPLRRRAPQPTGGGFNNIKLNM